VLSLMSIGLKISLRTKGTSYILPLFYLTSLTTFIRMLVSNVIILLSW
jgi:hypothetical protein